MDWFRQIRFRLSRLRNLPAAYEDLAEETRSHIEIKTHENIARGMSPEEARRVARIKFGSLVTAREQSREAWGFGWLETLRQDLRYGARSLAKSPGFTAAVLATLALGIGVGTAIFSIVNAVLLEPLPYKDPSRLVAIAANFSGKPELNINSMGAGEFLARRERSSTLRNIAVYRNSTWRIEVGADRRGLKGLQVSDGFFDVLGVEPALGRRFYAQDHLPRAELTVILLDGIWRRLFNADPAVVGKRYRMWSSNATIVGVMPPGFAIAKRSVDYLTAVDLSIYTNRPFRHTWFRAVARLEDGVSIEQAQAEQDVLTSQFKQQYPAYSRKGTRQADLLPLSEESAGEVRPALAVLFGAVAFIMLIVCANVANLLLGRALARRREIGVRAAIGAGRARLVRQLLTESLILSGGGGVIGFCLAQLMVAFFQDLTPDRSGFGGFLLQADSIRVDGTTLVFALGITVLAGLVFGIAPALRASRLDLASCLQSGARAAGGSVRDRVLHGSLVVAQTALAFVLVCGAGLLIRSTLTLYETGPGFQSQNRLQATVSWSPVVGEQRLQELRENLDNDELGRELGARTQLRAQALRERLLSVPHVRDVALSALPAMGPRPSEVGLPRSAATPNGCAVIPKLVSDNFFSVMGIPVLEGRAFQPWDRMGTQPVVVLSRQAVRNCGAGARVVGSEVDFWKLGPSVRVIGVVDDVRYEGVDTPGRSSAYALLRQVGAWGFHLIVQTDSKELSVVPGVREAILEVDPHAVIQDIRPLDHLVQDSAWKLNYSTLMLGGLAGLSLLLAAVGVYGVLSEMTRRRTAEIGLRMALGADSGQILRSVLRQGVALVGAGVVVGIAGAAGLTRFLGSLLFKVEPLDPWTFGAVAAVLLGAALFASYLPARRAASVDPMAAIRHE